MTALLGTNKKKKRSTVSGSKLHASESVEREYVIAGQGLELAAAKNDIASAFSGFSHTCVIAMQEIKSRYARSALGPFWLVIGTVSFICAFAIMGSVLLQIPWKAYMPYLAVGIIYWSFFSTFWIDSTGAYLASAQQMRSMRTSILDIMIRNLIKNLIIFAHSVPVLFVVCLALSDQKVDWLWVLPGFFAQLYFVIPIGLGLGILAVRFRDTMSAVATFLTFAVYLTPVWWLATSVTDARARIIIDYNPLYHLLNVVRNPWLGQDVPLVSWAVVLGVGTLVWLLVGIGYVKYRNRITLWL